MLSNAYIHAISFIRLKLCIKLAKYFFKKSENFFFKYSTYKYNPLINNFIIIKLCLKYIFILKYPP